MKYCVLFLSIFLHFCCAAVTVNKKEKRVLFIGNSLTSYHNMPQTLQRMMDEKKLNIKIEQLTYGGFRLAQYATLIDYVENGNKYSRKVRKNEVPVGVKTILSKKWDFVVLQEAGGCPLVPYFQMYSFEPTLIFFDSIIKSIKGKTVLYQDYPGTKFPKQLYLEKRQIDSNFAFPANANYSPNILISTRSNHFNNSGEQFHEIKKVYDKMAKKLNAGLVKVGYAFEEFKKTNKDISLYESDNSHPSSEGSYLIACLFYKYITGLAPADIKYSADLDVRQAELIRKFAGTIR
jgi:hypothetical protein